MSNKFDNIKNYGKEIQTIEEFVSAVRQVPGMYIGKIGNHGFINMIREVYQNSIDELMKDSSPCDFITVTFNQDTLEVTVSDNGRGLPFDKLDSIFAKQHTSSNYTKKKGEYSSGLHGVGAKVTNALSEYFIVESYINIPGMCEARRAEFIDGHLSKKGVYKIPNKNKLQGTRITFKPSLEVMGKITVTTENVFNMILGILYLTKIGARVRFTSIVKGKEATVELVNEDGIGSILNAILNTAVIKPVSYFDDTGVMKADIRFTFEANPNNPATIIGYSNFCPTASGTHINGFVDGVVKFFKDYMNKIYLKDANTKRKNKIVINTQDVKSALVGVVSVAHLEPIFTGQAKDELSNEDMYGFVKDLTINYLTKWSKDNSNELIKACKFLKSLAEIRMSSENEKVKLVDNYKSSTLSKGLPEKYVPPNGNKHLELILCEGDSASGSYKNSRCNKRQGLFPIRGKIKNPVGISKTNALANSETAGILAIIGGGAGTKSFDVNKVKWEKIIFATDADVDGAHISCLLLLILLTYCPELIAKGIVYKAVPPLYGLNNSKSTEYITNDEDFIKLVQKKFIKEHKVEVAHGKKSIPLSKSEMNKLLFDNIDYTYNIKRVAKAFSVDERLLELACIITSIYGVEPKKADYTKIKKMIKDKFRFLNVDFTNGRLSVTGLSGTTTNTLYMNDRILKECEPIMSAINGHDYMFRLDGSTVTLYELMTAFDNLKPKNITRYKGLGEMNPSQLAESTLHPDSNRTLLQYTIESAYDEINRILHLENNKKELISNVNVTRHDLS